jgi:hypothetical protein
VSGQTVTLSGVTLAAGGTLTITYGDKSLGGSGATVSTTPGTATFTAQSKATAGGTLTALAASPTATVYAADGSGTLTLPATNVSAGQAGQTLTFTYTAGTGGTNNGAVSIAIPTGWSPPSTTATGAGYTKASVGTVSVSGQTVTVSGVTLVAGGTLTITYGDKSLGGSGTTASTTPGTATFTAQSKATAGGTLTALAASPTATVYAADGSGTLTLPATNVSAGQMGQTLTFTYAAATGGTNNGAVSLAVPAGWSAPSTTGTAPGYTKTSAGAVSVSGQTVTVSGVTLAAGGTLTITYGDKSGGGSGATVSTTPGTATFTAQSQATAGGTLTMLAASPTATVYAADGSGTLTLPATNVSAGQTGQTLTFTYTAGTGGTNNGAVSIALPAGWSAPSTTGTAPGYTKTSAGAVSVSGQTVTVSGVTLAAGGTLTITYGDKSLGGSGATVSTTPGTATFTAQSQATAGGTLTALAASPTAAVYAADGSGTLTLPAMNVSAGQTGQTLTFTYTAGTGGTNNGAVSIAVPAGWSAPSTTGTTPGYTKTSAGAVSVSGQTVTLSGVTLAAGGTLTITYGDKSLGGSGATVSTTPGTATFTAQSQATAGGTLTALAASPTATVYAADGSGTLTLPATNVSAGQAGQTLTFTYTAGTGGTNNGAVSIAVPAGWSAPSTTGTAPGYAKTSAGAVSVSGQTVTVSGVTLAAGGTLTITYGDKSLGGSGTTASTTPGTATFTAQSQATAGGTLAALATSPSLVVYAADGSGTLTLPATNVSAGQTGQTLTFTYAAATGGTNNGAVSIAVPAGWSAPSTTGTAPGYTKTSAGAVSVSGQTVTVSGVTLAAGGTLTITYGDKSLGGSGATVSTTPGTATFTAQSQATAGGTLTMLAASPTATVYAADGSGTLTVSPTAMSAGQAGQTLTFTYPAGNGGTNNGVLTLTAPAGWSSPSTTVTAPGYTKASTGTVSVSGQTLTVSGLTGVGTLTVTYGDTSGGGPGVTAPATPGIATFVAQEKSTAGGILTALPVSANVTIYSADGSGTLTVSPTAVDPGQAGLTLPFTYTAAAGGTKDGSVTVTVPAGWTAPSTTAAAAGYITVSAGTVTLSGQTIRVDGVTLAESGTLTITYGDKNGGGLGVTSPSTPGTATFTAQAKSTVGGTLTPLAVSPSVTLVPPIPTATLSITPGRTPTPGGYFSLTFTSQSAVSWSGPEWRTAGTTVWKPLGGSGTVTPGTPFAVSGWVPKTDKPYQVRVKLTNATGTVGYTQPIMMGAPYLGGLSRADGSITVPATAFNPGNWTVQMAFQPTANPVGATERYLWSLAIDGNNSYALLLSPSGRLHLVTVSGGVTVDTLSASDPVLQAGQTYQIAIRGDGAKVAVFLNGVKLATGETPYTEPVGSLPTKMYFGAGSTQGTGPTGTVTRIRIFGRARTDQEITAAAAGSQTWSGDPTCSEVETFTAP